MASIRPREDSRSTPIDATPSQDGPPIHLVIPTHTTRHLRRTLIGYAHQDLAPSSITVTCDTDDPQIGLLLEEVVVQTRMSITQVYRARHEEPRRSQTRNNGIRSLVKRGLTDEDVVLFTDGDCIPARDMVAVHARRARKADFVIGSYILLDEETTARLDEDRSLRRELEVAPTPAQMHALRALERKARRHQVLRRFGLVKPHKPKILGANTSVHARNLLAINGFDEEYLDWGYEDDDFGRRLYRSGARSTIAITEAILFHQWHPSCKNEAWQTGSVATRFNMKLPNRCVSGIDSPLEQNEVHERTLTG